MAVLNTVTSLTGTETSLPRVAQGVYNRELLSRAQPYLCHQKYGQTKSLSTRSGTQMVFRRWEKLAQVTTPLTEGVTPSGVSPTKTDVVATLQWFGSYIPITDKIELTHVDPIITEFSALMGENMGESIDTIHANALSGGTNWVRVQDDDAGTLDLAMHPVGSSVSDARNTVAGTLCRSALDYAIRTLDGALAKTFSPQVNAGSGEHTYPIAAAYYCLIHTDQIHDLYTAKGGFMIYNTTTGILSRDTAFTPVEQYASQAGVQTNEVGKYRNIRFIATTNLKIWADAGYAVSGLGLKSTTGTSADVYSTLVLGRDAYGIVPLAGNSAKIIVKPRTSGGTGDPLEQRSTIGWKAITCPAVILNEAWMLRIECATSA
jgi:N4-gp56 family major capsid protein